MAIFNVVGDTFAFEPLMFSGGKERITVNGVRVFEGRVSAVEPAKFSIGGVAYRIVKQGRGYEIRATNTNGVLCNDVFMPKEPPFEKYVPLIFFCKGVLFLLLGLFLFAIGIPAYRKAKSCEDWPIASAIVTTSMVEDSTVYIRRQGMKSLFTPVVHYQYSVNGKVFTSDRIATSAPGSSTDRSWASAFVLKYPKGSATSVRYDPSNHDFAVLEPGLSMDDKLLLFASAFATLFGLVAIVVGKILGKKRATKSQNPKHYRVHSMTSYKQN